MVNYRRDKTKGGTYFFTLALQNRQSRLLTKYIKLLGHSFRRAQLNNFFTVDAIVILPEHLHTVITLPDGDANYSTRLRQIKTYFLHALLNQGQPLTKNYRNEYNLWQKRFWEHLIRDEQDKITHIDYIHYNPVKHNLVKQVQDWPHSSFHRYVRKGLLNYDWGGTVSSRSLGELK
ncbi:REP-associated tyrosine transposase [Legionella jamestowniensis]|uniref:Transposase IS200 like protein n=1 Tax=Legionella jamestowniensis TaxID=455 RepID=A0A0W0UGU8_9GAMM|nr:transposase [Legionella jamestowniensis]KTD06854.1 Transposase IS200 like protein [Legionella jamestowniensis]OCH97599.1 hypothetical protein A8135_13990 [Legionella jamestowniensis]SFL82214.1 putative transposase [Legionella jamestowniensis DSM 19215]